MTNEFELSGDQQLALETIHDWYGSAANKPITLGGYAGTGKTTVMTRLNEFIPSARSIAYCAYTGKAAQVLRRTLRKHGIKTTTTDEVWYHGELIDIETDLVSTIHRLIYIPVIQTMCAGPENSGKHWLFNSNKCDQVNHSLVLDAQGSTYQRVSGFTKRTDLSRDVDLIVVDEASMVSADIWSDLLSFGIPILAVGDHGQLPPVRANSFSLMNEPVIRLERVHRQAENDPIINMSRWAREKGHIPMGTYGPTVRKVKINDAPDLDWSKALLVLCGRNSTRNDLNAVVRIARGHSGELPVIGDRVVCLRNNRLAGVFNGMLGTVASVAKPVNDSSETVKLEINPDDWMIENNNTIHACHARIDQFGSTSRDDTFRANEELWDYGYALTVHKSQGSEAESVVLFEERLPGGNDKHARWLYTGVTRAKKELTVIQM